MPHAPSRPSVWYPFARPSIASRVRHAPWKTSWANGSFCARRAAAATFSPPRSAQSLACFLRRPFRRGKPRYHQDIRGGRSWDFLRLRGRRAAGGAEGTLRDHPPFRCGHLPRHQFRLPARQHLRAGYGRSFRSAQKHSFIPPHKKALRVVAKRLSAIPEFGDAPARRQASPSGCCSRREPCPSAARRGRRPLRWRWRTPA